jgi:hypothetical protein
MFAELPPTSSPLADEKRVGSTPPQHSSPLGLMLAALAQFVEARRRAIRVGRTPGS